jgi:hypothetical protein
MRNVHKRFGESKNTEFIFFLISCRLWGNVGKYDIARQAMDYNTENALSVLDYKGHENTLRICNTSCFS